MGMGAAVSNKYKYIFVILTYRNAEDLYDLDRSLKDKNVDYHIVLVNSFFDDETEKHIKDISNQLNCTFLSVENRGYGCGNNCGIEYAMNHFDFDYLVVANSDLVLQEFDDRDLPCKNAIIGPRMKTINGKSQNPYWDLERTFTEKLIYTGHKKHNRLILNLGQGINKVFRETFLFRMRSKNNTMRVYAVHGACILFTRDAVEKLFPVFDSSMFLYYEEAYLAYKAKHMRVEVYYYPKINVLHKEDGSTKGLTIDLSHHAVESYLYYYENCRLKDA